MTNSTRCFNCEDNPYPFNASFAGAFVFAALFTLAGSWHLYQYIKHKAWFFYFLLIGIAMQALGFWAKTYSTKNLKTTMAYIIFYFLTMLAPSVLAAALYQAFGRLLFYTVPPSHRNFRTMLLPVRFIAPFFVISDIVSFFITMVGIGVAVSQLKSRDVQKKADSVKKGTDIMRVGLIMQTVIFGAFAILSARIVLISRKWQFAWPDNGKWRRLGWAVSIGSFLIFSRALYRIFEFTINNGDNYLMKNEWPVYIFDSLLMLALVAFFGYFHPGKYLPQTHTSLNHAYKRFANTGNQSNQTLDPRFKSVDSNANSGVELGRTKGPQIAVQQAPSQGREWAPPQQQQQYRYTQSPNGEMRWGARPPGGMHMGGNVYMPARGSSRSPSPNPGGRFS